MKLKDLFPQVEGLAGFSKDVRALAFDSRNVTENSVFFAVRGEKIDGHDYLLEILKKRPVAVVAQKNWQGLAQLDSEKTVVIIAVENSRQALEEAAKIFYQNPAEEVFAVGVTGTNGKTSTTYMIEAVLNQIGLPTGVLGTINHHFKNQVWESELTTPDPVTLQKRLREFVLAGARAAAFEVSSHALSQNRVATVAFDAMVFTNLTRDHLDYHKTMEEYFLAKEKLFLEVPEKVVTRKLGRPVAVINVDDPFGQRLRVSSKVTKWTYGTSASDFQFRILKSDFSGTQFSLTHQGASYNFLLPLVGQHNVYNAVAAVAVGVAAGAAPEDAFAGLKTFAGVPGRLEKVIDPKGLRHVFVDYAHTDDAIKTVLEALNVVRHSAGLTNRIISVFGCGGDRDRGKRPLMLRAATAGSDLVFVTSDNPRTEDPKLIIDDILKGVGQTESAKIKVQVDRKVAITKALREAHAGDVVLIAGKGHEDYQIIGTTKYPFSDSKIAAEVLNGL